MNIARILEMVKHAPRRAVRECSIHYDLARLWLYNRLGKAQVTQPGTPIVSMTTWERRIATAYLAIESIARGSVRPSRLILWIDDEALFRNLPATLRRLQRRGLEVKLCQDYGPHKKYYPFVASQDSFDTPLATADDDMVYPPNWLSGLANSNREHPSLVNCWCALRIAMGEDGLAPFRRWGTQGSLDPSFRNQAQGTLGVIYPVLLLDALKAAGTGFRDCCPRADDLWLHVTAIRSGIKIRQISQKLSYFRDRVDIPNTQAGALYTENILGGANDVAIRATYAPADIETIRNDRAPELAMESR